MRDNEIRTDIAKAVHEARMRRLGLPRCIQLFKLIGDHLAEVGAKELGQESKLGGNPKEIHEARHMMTNSFAEQFKPLVANETPETLLMKELDVNSYEMLRTSGFQPRLCIALEGRRDAIGLDLYHGANVKPHLLYEGYWTSVIGKEFADCISSIEDQFPTERDKAEPRDLANLHHVSEDTQGIFDIQSIAKNGIIRSYEYAPDYTISQAEILTIVTKWEPYRTIAGRRGLYLGKPMIDSMFVRLHEKGVPISAYLRGSFLAARYPWSTATTEACDPLVKELVLRTDPIPENWMTVFLKIDEGLRIVRPAGSWTNVVWEAYDDVCKVDTGYHRFKQALDVLIPEMIKELKKPEDFFIEMERVKKTISGSKWLCDSFIEVAGCSRSGQ